jgi:hypothetical protein
VANRGLIVCMLEADADFSKKPPGLRYAIVPCPGCTRSIVIAQSSIDMLLDPAKDVHALCNTCALGEKIAPDAEIMAAPGASEDFREALRDAVAQLQEQGSRFRRER